MGVRGFGFPWPRSEYEADPRLPLQSSRKRARVSREGAGSARGCRCLHQRLFREGLPRGIVVCGQRQRLVPETLQPVAVPTPATGTRGAVAQQRFDGAPRPQGRTRGANPEDAGSSPALPTLNGSTRRMPVWVRAYPVRQAVGSISHLIHVARRPVEVTRTRRFSSRPKAETRC
jgi:hypothetical protein